MKKQVLRGIAAFVAFWVGVVVGIVLAASGDDWKDGLIAFGIGLLVTVALIANILIRALKWIVSFLKKIFSETSSPTLFTTKRDTTENGQDGTGSRKTP